MHTSTHMRRVLTTLMTAALMAAGAGMGHAAQDEFTLSSTDVRDDTFSMMQVYDSFGCTGKNVSPALAWKNAPSGTQSFALTMFDPDAPTGSGWWHWVVLNIPANTSSIPTGASRTPKMPAGALEMRTDFGTTGYGGPCPPPGDKPHRYVFTLYALKVDRIDIDPQATAANASYMMRSNAIATATFTASYGR